MVVILHFNLFDFSLHIPLHLPALVLCVHEGPFPRAGFVPHCCCRVVVCCVGSCVVLWVIKHKLFLLFHIIIIIVQQKNDNRPTKQKKRPSYSTTSTLPAGACFGYSARIQSAVVAYSNIIINSIVSGGDRNPALRHRFPHQRQ